MQIYKVRHFPSMQHLRKCSMEPTFLRTKRIARTWSALQFVKKSVSYLFSIRDARFIFYLTSPEDIEFSYVAIEEYDLDSGNMRTLYKIPYKAVLDRPRVSFHSVWGKVSGYEFDLEKFKVGD